MCPPPSFKFVPAPLVPHAVFRLPAHQKNLENCSRNLVLDHGEDLLRSPMKSGRRLLASNGSPTTNTQCAAQLNATDDNDYLSATQRLRDSTAWDQQMQTSRLTYRSNRYRTAHDQKMKYVRIIAHSDIDDPATSTSSSRHNTNAYELQNISCPEFAQTMNK